jgi:hypothetical protein
MTSGLPIVNRKRSRPAPVFGSTSSRIASSRFAGLSFHRLETLVSSREKPMPV